MLENIIVTPLTMKALKMTEKELEELRARNDERAKAMIKALGNKWLCHPDNAISKDKYAKTIIGKGVVNGLGPQKPR